MNDIYIKDVLEAETKAKIKLKEYKNIWRKKNKYLTECFTEASLNLARICGEVNKIKAEYKGICCESEEDIYAKKDSRKKYDCKYYLNKYEGYIPVLIEYINKLNAAIIKLNDLYKSVDRIIKARREEYDIVNYSSKYCNEKYTSENFDNLISYNKDKPSIQINNRLL